jgi:hypothetical protein
MAGIVQYPGRYRTQLLLFQFAHAGTRHTGRSEQYRNGIDNSGIESKASFWQARQEAENSYIKHCSAMRHQFFEFGASRMSHVLQIFATMIDCLNTSYLHVIYTTLEALKEQVT